MRCFFNNGLGWEISMDKFSEKSRQQRPGNSYAAFAGHKISKKEKRAWIAAGLAIVVLLLCWWARSSQ